MIRSKNFPVIEPAVFIREYFFSNILKKYLKTLEFFSVKLYKNININGDVNFF